MSKCFAYQSFTDWLDDLDGAKRGTSAMGLEVDLGAHSS